jgi:hypothetical protein
VPRHIYVLLTVIHSIIDLSIHPSTHPSIHPSTNPKTPPLSPPSIHATIGRCRFYEWVVDSMGQKQPYYVHYEDGRPMTVRK